MRGIVSPSRGNVLRGIYVKTQSKGFLVFRGSSFPNRTVRLEPVDFATKSPFYGQLLFKEIKFVGKAEDDTVLFIRHPYELINPERLPEEVIAHHFAIALEVNSKLKSVTVFHNEKEVKVLDRSEKASVELKVETISKEGVQLLVRGTYDRLTIIVRDLESEVWNHIFLDIVPTESSSKTIKVPWDQFPVAKCAVFEAVAVRGIDVANSYTESVDVSVQPVKIIIFPVGFREVKTEDGVVYQFAFGAKGELHGRSLPDSAFHWQLLGEAHTGRLVQFTTKGEKRFRIKLKAIDPLGREFLSKFTFAPATWSKKLRARPK